jgi:Fe-S cluster assembly protein SufD
MSSSLSAASIGLFTDEAFHAHLRSQPAGAPSWWLDRKRNAFARFSELPMPSRTDEGWRFSSRETLALQGFDAPDGATPAPALESIQLGDAMAALTFVDGVLDSRRPLPVDLAAKGVVVGTLQEALTTHSALLREHFMAQPQKLGSEKFAALHTAFVTDGAFILVPKGVELPPRLW